MPALNFREIPPAHHATGQQDTFELFARDFCLLLGLEILSGPDRGPDGGRDLIVLERRQGPMGETGVRWLVSCKHKAHSMQDRIANAVIRQDLMFENGEIITFCAHDTVGEAMLRMAMVAKEIDALTQLVRAQRVANFDARFGTLLRSKGAKVRPKQRVTGASGQEYTVDLVADEPKQALIQTITAEQGMAKIAMTRLAFDDLRDGQDDRPRIVVLEKVLAHQKMALLRKATEEVYLAGQVDELLRDLARTAG